MSTRGKLLSAGIDSDGVSIDLYNSNATLKVNGTQVISSQQSAEADLNQVIAGPTIAEVQAISDKVDAILAKLRNHGIIAS